MNEEHENYRPRSPDLSGFVPPTRPHRLPSYHQTDTNIGPGYSFSPRGSYDASPYFSPSTAQPSASYFSSQPFAAAPPIPRIPSIPNDQGQHFNSSRILNSAPHLNSAQPYDIHQTRFPDTDYTSQPAVISQQAPVTFQGAPTSDMARTRQRKTADAHDIDYDPNNTAPSRTIAPQGQVMPTSGTAQSGQTSDPAHGIEVKTKFPVARIKRIMQADEDVGKVAQATPTAVSKALELFMITLVLKGAEEAKSHSSRRVTVQHLKAALMKDGQFDFLTDICENVPDEGSRKGRAKSDAKSEDSEEGEAGPRKKGKASKKRKADSDDESD